MVNRSEVLRRLPPVGARRDVIVDRQDTKDIIREVLEAHQFFAIDYDKIAGFFDAGANEDVYTDLFDFCKQNIRYLVEKESLQTTRSPAALLGMGQGDCKHYAGLIGGVLDALNRKGSRHIDWSYRFASYNVLDHTPQHVFVVARDGNREVWIDPVLKEFNQRSPIYFFKQDKKPQTMLQRIYGAPAVPEMGSTSFGAALLKSYQSGSFYFAQIFGNTADIHNNPPIKFLVDGEPYNLPVPAHLLREQGQASKIIPMPQGLTVVYPSTWKGLSVRPDMLRPAVTPGRELLIMQPDGTRYDFKGTAGSTNAMLIANGNLLLDLLVAATGAIQLAFQSYPDCENKQRFYDNILRLRNMNFFYAREIKTFAGSVVEGLKDAIAEVGKGFVKFTSIIPRQAFLLLVKLNVRDMAKALDKNITAGKSAEIKKKWEGFGGDYGVLVSNINQGKGKARIFGYEDPSYTIGAVEGIGELTVAAAIASATPAIALLASFLKGVGGPEVDKFVDDAVGRMNKLLVAAGEDPIAVAQSAGVPAVVTDTDGNEIVLPADPSAKNKSVLAWVEDNPMLAGAGAIAAGVIILKATKKKRA